MKTILLLVRHGESEANRCGFFAGQMDVPLLEKGLQQAEATAGYIQENYQVDRVYASDLQRAYATGHCIAARLQTELLADPGLREINAGDWTGRTFNCLEAEDAAYTVWKTDIGRVSCTGGESVRELADRVMATLNRIAMENPGKTLVIATHATPIRAAQTVIQLGDSLRMREIPWVSNASVTVLEYEDGVWECKAASLDAHLGSSKTVFPANV